MNLNAKNRVLVVGDIILDEYINGKVTRISPEAPIPIIKVDRIKYVLGGAANVANNLAAYGAEVSIAGFVGKDKPGAIARKLLDERGVKSDSICIAWEAPTIEKQRVVGNSQQIVRLDYGEDYSYTEKEYRELEEKIDDVLNQFEVVVISDYDKGVCLDKICRKVIDKSMSYNISVLVDPKGNNWSKYAGASLITPNVKEISELLGKSVDNTDTDIEGSCKGLCAKLNIDYLLITRSEKGMSLLNRLNQFMHVLSKAKEVYDVTGAGDTVIATLACFWDKGENVREIMNIANTAAGIAVSKMGTSTLTIDEIKQALIERRYSQIKEKIVTIDALQELLAKWKEENQSVVFTNGCFDIFHSGHVHSIYTAATFGQRLIVAINSNDSVRRNKGSTRPINDEYDRAYVIAALGCVDAVIIFDEDTPERLLSMIRPTVLVKGADYKADEIVGREYAQRVELVDYINGYSTTSIIHKLSD